MPSEKEKKGGGNRGEVVISFEIKLRRNCGKEGLKKEQLPIVCVTEAENASGKDYVDH